MMSSEQPSPAAARAALTSATDSADRTRVVKYWIGTGILYGVALIVGLPEFSSEPLYWIPAAALVATPLLIGAVLERRA